MPPSWSTPPGGLTPPGGSPSPSSPPGRLQAGAASAAPTTPGGSAGFNAKPGIIAFRPLSVGDILDGSFKAFRRNQGSLLALSLLLNVLAAVPAAAVVAAQANGWLSIPADVFGMENDDVLSGTVLPLLALALTMGFVSMLLPVFVAYAIGEATLGRRTSLASIWAATKSRVLPAIGLQLLVALVMVIAIACFVLLVVATSSNGSSAGSGALVGLVAVVVLFPALTWFTIKVQFATAALVLERLGVRAALLRSFALTRGRWWRTFGILLLAGIVAGIAGQVIQVPIGLVGGVVVAVLGSSFTGAVWVLAVLQLITSVASNTLVTPFLAGVTSLQYVDARIRSEGFDQALLRAANPGWR